MTDPFGGPPQGSPGPPLDPFTHFPIATDTPKVRKAPAFAFSVVFGAAIVFGVWYVLAQQDPNRRRDAVAVIASASAAPIDAPRRGALARSVAKKRLVMVNDYANDVDAEAAAREACAASDCVLVETFAASCAAVARGKDDRREAVHGFATRESAEDGALARCGRGCVIQASSCPLPR